MMMRASRLVLAPLVAPLCAPAVMPTRVPARRAGVDRPDGRGWLATVEGLYSGNLLTPALTRLMRCVSSVSGHYALEAC